MRRIALKRAFFILAAFAMCFPIMATPVFAKTVFKLAHTDIEDPFFSPDAAFSAVFKSMVESGTNGEIEVKIFPANVLGKERETMEQVQNNLTQGYLATVGGMAPFWPEVAVLDTPFAFPSFPVAYDVMDGWFGDKLKKSFFEKSKMRCVEIMDANGFMQLTNKIRPIKTAKDMQGIKFRTMTLPSHIAFFEALGASAVPVSWAETYTALQTGVVDGQQNPIGYIISGNIYEVQKYLTMTNHLFTTHWFIVNDDFLKSLSEENRKIFYDAARVATVASRGITRIAQATGKGMPLLMKNLQVYQPTAAELQTFSAICIPASRKFVKEKMGDTIAALQDDMLKAIEESKKKLGY